MRARDEELREIGKKTVLLIEELVEVFARIAAQERESSGEPEGVSKPSLGAARAAAAPGADAASYAALKEQVDALHRRLTALEQRMAPVFDGRAISAAPSEFPTPVPQKRGDDARRSSAALSDTDSSDSSRSPADSTPPTPPMPARLARTESRRLALAAARALDSEGKPVTLAAVAREAGLKYSQVVYAFRRRRDLLDALTEEKT